MSPSCILDGKELNPAHKSQSLSHTHTSTLPAIVPESLAVLSLKEQFTRK